MLTSVALVALFAVELLGLLLIPFGFPGLWVQVAATGGVAALGAGSHLAWRWVALFVALAGVGEVVELLSGRWGARRFGGSGAAAWGALVGGFVGAVVGGIPVPVIGALVMSFVGTFVGALAGEILAQRRLAPNLRVGFGAVLGRLIGLSTKLAIGFVILIVSIAVVLV